MTTRSPFRDTGIPGGAPRLWGLVLILCGLGFGGMQIWFWSDRSMWIDEVSQLLNYPLDGPLAAFGPLPEAQQAAPPVFNLVMHALSGFDIRQMRLVLCGLVLAIMLGTAARAFRFRILPMVAVALVMLGAGRFMLLATELKFYSFDIAGFVLFTGWVFAKDTGTPFDWRDVVLLLAGMALGVATLVGACVAAAVVLGARLIARRLTWPEIVRAGCVGVAAGVYYLQIAHATRIQVTAFPDVYDTHGLAAVLGFARAGLDILRPEGVVLLGVSGLACVYATRRVPGSMRVVVFCILLAAAFAALAALGKYPATQFRHVAWVLGCLAILVGTAVHGLGLLLSARRDVPAGVLAAVLVMGMGINALRGSLHWPPVVSEGAYDALVETLSDLPASDVVLYYGAYRMVPLALRRGEDFGHHRYRPMLPPRTGAIDPVYFTPEWLDQPPGVIAGQVRTWLRDDPLAWSKMVSVLRMTEDYRPLAEFALDSAPRGGTAFYIVALHIRWDAQAREMRAASLRAVLDDRMCTYREVIVAQGRSAGVILEVICPEA